MKKYDVILIGGGASGLMAAITAAREQKKVCILEHKDRAGKKILSTGNGRCNLSNTHMDASCYHCGDKTFVAEALRLFSTEDTLRFFSSIGVEIKSRAGYLYPVSDQASAVLDCLRMETFHQGVDLYLSCDVKKVLKQNQGFQIETSLGSFLAPALILAAGSMAAPQTGSDGSGYELARSLGHSIIKPLPALTQLRCGEKFWNQLAGVRADGRVTLTSEQRVLASEQGELQFTAYGLSGIPVFQVSGEAAVALDQGKHLLAHVNLFPDCSREDFINRLQKRRKLLTKRPCSNFLTGMVHKKIELLVLKLCHITPEYSTGQLKAQDLENLTELLLDFTVPVLSTNSFDQAQVCSGGVDVREILASSMASRLVPGLYFAGEIMDADGICGGYNLQWAWTSGYLAGKHAAEDPDRMGEKL